MKKKVIKKKLTLSKETIARLETGDLAKVVGGYLSEINVSFCFCTPNCVQEH